MSDEESVKMSPAVGKLAEALAKAQGEFEAIGKTREVEVTMKTGGKYKFAYAPLDTVFAAVRPALAKHGLALTQLLSGNGNRVITTTLMHSSGEWISSTVSLPGQANSSQEFGSQVTYMRRYAIVSILGVVAEEDDDGNAADGNDATGRDRAPAAPPRPQPGQNVRAPRPSSRGPSDRAQERADRLVKMLTMKQPEGCGWALPHCAAWGKKRFHVNDPVEMTEEQFRTAELLALAYIEGGQKLYDEKLAEMVAAGRAFDDQAKGAAA